MGARLFSSLVFPPEKSERVGPQSVLMAGLPWPCGFTPQEGATGCQRQGLWEVLHSQWTDESVGTHSCLSLLRPGCVAGGCLGILLTSPECTVRQLGLLEIRKQSSHSPMEALQVDA